MAQFDAGILRFVLKKFSTASPAFRRGGSRCGSDARARLRNRGAAASIRRGFHSVCCAGLSTVCRCGYARVHYRRRGSRSSSPIVVIDVFFGQQVRIKLQIAFVNQTLLPDDVGVAIIVFVAVGRQAVLVATVAVRRADKAFSPTQDSPMLPVCESAWLSGRRFRRPSFAVTRYGVVARFAVQSFRVQHEVLPSPTLMPPDVSFSKLPLLKRSPSSPDTPFSGIFFRDFSVGNIYQTRHCPSCTTALPARAGFRPVATKRYPPSGHGRARSPPCRPFRHDGLTL